MALSLRKIRLRLVWLLIIPFLWFARPSPVSLLLGSGLSVLGLFVRAWAAGFIRKDQQLATSGPYGHTRNPLYLGSFLLGLGVTLAGAQWFFVLAFLVFFFGVYGATIRSEAELLEGLFGDQYRDYAANVPLLLPRVTPYRAPEPWVSAGAFSMERYAGNKEYEALLGTVAAFGFLWIRMYIG